MPPRSTQQLCFSLAAAGETCRRQSSTHLQLQQGCLHARQRSVHVHQLGAEADKIVVVVVDDLTQQEKQAQHSRQTREESVADGALQAPSAPAACCGARRRLRQAVQL